MEARNKKGGEDVKGRKENGTKRKKKERDDFGELWLPNRFCSVKSRTFPSKSIKSHNIAATLAPLQRPVKTSVKGTSEGWKEEDRGVAEGRKEGRRQRSSRDE